MAANNLHEIFLIILSLSLHLSYGIVDEFLCAHKPPKRHEVITHVNLRQGQNRIRRQNIYQNLRIKLFYDVSIKSLPEEKQLFINSTILPRAIEYWQQTLMVQSANVPIRLNRKCQDSRIFIRKNSPFPFCRSSCEDVTKCGEVEVPKAHLEMCRFCNQEGENCQEHGSAGPGVSNSDFILYVSAIQTERCDIGRTVAYAAHCQLESEFDRPVAGHANLCPMSISTKTQEVQNLLSTVKHEILHALGFSVGLYGLFRDDRGQPYTPRGEMGQPVYNESLQAYEWSDKVIRSITRKNWKVRGGKIKRQIHMIVTPHVKEEVQKHFNCPTLEGAELEDQGLDGTSWTHWEKRVFENEAMTGTHTQYPVFSRITLALMEDTGWYKANYSMAQPLTWGKNLGCDFVQKSCKEWMDTQLAKNEHMHPFCNRVKKEPLETECTESRDAVALCNLVSYVNSLPPEYQNFDSIPNVPSKNVAFYGGSVSLADYCPYIQEFTWKSQGIAVRGSRCEYPDNNPEPENNFALEYYGSGSKCFHHDQQWVEKSCDTKRYWQHWGSGCYKYFCMDGRLHLEVANRTITCYYSQQRYKIQILSNDWLHNGSIICPSCQDVCKKMLCLNQSRFEPMPHLPAPDDLICAAYHLTGLFSLLIMVVFTLFLI